MKSISFTTFIKLGVQLASLQLIVNCLSAVDAAAVKDTAPGKKNVIFMVADGMGPTSLSLARSYRQFKQGLSKNDTLVMDSYMIGSHRTSSDSSLVTDSAAGGTAFACGLKTYNGAISVDPNSNPCGTVLEAFHLQNYLTGLVVNTRITDATPAVFVAHVDDRGQEDLIAQQELGEHPLGRVVDLLIGGGRCLFIPESEDEEQGCREDDRNLINEAQQQNWTYVGNRQQFDSLQQGENVTLPLLALLARKDIPFEIDRDSAIYPSLAEQAKVALTSLSKATEDSDQGFFLMIEGSRIDHAGHHNDAQTYVREVLAFDEAFAEVVKFIDESDVETIMVSTADHETGGLAAARQVDPDDPEYFWYPEILDNATHSGQYLAGEIVKRASVQQNITDYLHQDVLVGALGLDLDYVQPEELLQLQEHVDKAIELEDDEKLMHYLNQLVSVRSHTGWTTHGHSAVDVEIYAHSNSERLSELLLTRGDGVLGNQENADLGTFLANLAGVSLKDVTEKIKDIKHADESDDADLTKKRKRSKENHYC